MSTLGPVLLVEQLHIPTFTPLQASDEDSSGPGLRAPVNAARTWPQGFMEMPSLNPESTFPDDDSSLSQI